MKNFIRNFSQFKKVNEQDMFDETSLTDDRNNGDMKVYVLVFNIDISGTPSSSSQFVKVSRSKEELESLMDEYNAAIERDYDEDDMEFDGISVSDRPYYSIEEYMI